MIRPSRKAIIVSSPNAYRMNADLLAVALEQCLRAIDFDVLQLTRHAKPPKLGKRDLSFFLQLGVPPNFARGRARKIVLNFHPTCPDSHYGRHAHKDFSVIKDNFKKGLVDFVFDYNPHTTKWLQDAGIRAVFCPIGYHEVFDNGVDCADHGNAKNVYFIGNVGPGRVKSGRRDLIEATGAHLVRECWGYDRVNYTRLDGVHLSLASYQKFRTCLTLRLIVLLASNARAIVHEKTDWCPLEHDEHCLIGTPDEVPGYVEMLKNNPALYQKLRLNAYSFVRDEYRFDDHLYASMREVGVF